MRRRLLRVVFSLLASLFARVPSATALDLVHARRVLQEMRFERQGPRPQSLVFRSIAEPGGDWPARFAEAERRRRRKAARRAKTWSGFLGGVAVWGVDGEVLAGPKTARRIRRRLEFWADAPGGFRMHAIAEDPGGRGRRLLERRVGRILRELRRFQRRKIRDPFATLRNDADGEKWTESYRVGLPSRNWLELTGPAPEVLPDLPTIPESRPLFGEFPLERTEPGAPEVLRRALVPGYLVRFGPKALSRREERWLRAVLGIEAGVEATGGVTRATPVASEARGAVDDPDVVSETADEDLDIDLDLDLDDF